MHKYLVDILVPTAKRGGPEKIINMMGIYMKDRDIRLRVVQMVFGGEKWTVPEIEFYHIYPDGMDQTTDTFVDGYRKFLSDHDKPDAILATAWPFLCYSAKMSIADIATDIPVVSWMHATVSENEKHGYGGVDSLSYADAHFAISETIANEIKRALPEAAVYRVYNPIQNPVIGSKSTDLLKLVFIGRLVEIKRVDVILRALDMTNLPWRLSVYGEGVLRRELSDMMADMGLEERVRFMGWCDDPWDTASDAAYLIVSSDYDSFPLVAIEAMARGIPVISTPCEGIMEYLKVGENGYIFPFHDPVVLSELLDAIGEGVQPKLDGDKCIETARPYLYENALDDFWVKLTNVIELSDKEV